MIAAIIAMVSVHTASCYLNSII